LRQVQRQELAFKRCSRRLVSCAMIKEWLCQGDHLNKYECCVQQGFALGFYRIPVLCHKGRLALVYESYWFMLKAQGGSARVEEGTGTMDCLDIVKFEVGD